jgi:thiamine biosynthesis lipoprotein
MVALHTRRRFLAIAGAAAGLSLASGRLAAARAVGGLHVWRGVALGAEASIQLWHPDEARARRLIELCVAEIERLERIFSLYRADSAVSRLNAAGALEVPPLELVELLGRAAAVSRATDGVFDVTVQPLWQLYAAHFARPDADPAGPDLRKVLPLVDWRGVVVEAGRIRFARPGMAITLNGIAQGYITDKVADLLRANGIGEVLLDLGEVRALGRHPSGRPWRVGLADPRSGTDSRLLEKLDITDAAVATSGGYGTLFDPAGRHTHLLDPRSGGSARAARGVTVVADDATTADALSTAFALMTDAAIAARIQSLRGLRVLVAEGGRVTAING